MKNFIVYLIMMVVSFCASAQQIQSVQLPTESSDFEFGDSISVKFTNSSQGTVTFFPLMQGLEDAPPDVFRSEQHLVDWIAAAAVGVPPEDHIIVLSKRIASLLKTDVWVNNALYPSLWSDWVNYPNGQAYLEQSFAKNYAMPGVLVGSESLQCGNFAQITAMLLVRTGLVSEESLRLVTSHRHVFLEILHNGVWKIFDTDTGTPSLMTKNELNHEQIRALGWPAAMDEFKLHQSESAFDSQSIVSTRAFSGPFCDSVQKVEQWYEYYRALTDTGYSYAPFFFETEGFSSELTIPGGGRLEVKYANNRLFLDTLVYPELHQQLKMLAGFAMESFRAGDMTTMSEYAYIMTNLLANHFGVDPEIAGEQLFDGKLVFNSGSWRPFLDERTVTPSYTIVVPPGNHIIGVDIKAPGKVLSVEASSGSQVYLSDVQGNDTLITGGNSYEVNFWESGDTSRYIEAKANHYLQQGWINALDTVYLEVSWNHAIFNFLHGTLEIETTQPLGVEYRVNGVDILDNTIVGVNQQENFTGVYPNPATDVLNVPFGDVTLSDTAGRTVLACTACKSVSVGEVSPGLYVLNHTKGSTLVVIQ